MDERGDEELRAEGEEGAEERRVGEGLRELRESVRHVDGGRLRVRDEVGEAEQADRAALLGLEDECGAVAL